MAYPGNLFALVARDRHFKSNTNSAMETKMEDHVRDDFTRRVRGKHGRRLNRQASYTPTENSLAAGGKPRSVHALALSRELRSCQSYKSVQSYQSHLAHGAMERATPPPSKYDDHVDTRSSTDMDTIRGTDEAPDHQSEDRTIESDATARTETRPGAGGVNTSARIKIPSTESTLSDKNGFSYGCKAFGGVGGSDVIARSARAVDPKTVGSTFLGRFESPQRFGWLESYSAGQAKHLGVPLKPRNHFRDAMTHRTRTKEARSVNVTPSARLLSKTNDMPGGQKRGRLVGARASAGKSRLLRYTIRWQEIAMLHRVFEAGSNRRPAGETLERVGRALKDIACESSSPGILSRAQFFSTLSRTLESCHPAALHRMYSSFDPDGTDRVRYVDILACLWITHKPEAEALLEGVQQTFLGNLGALDPELHAELTKGGRQIAWRFLRRMFKLFDRAGEGLGVGVDDTERLFQVCATSDQDILQMSSTFASYMQHHCCSELTSTEQIFTESMFEKHFCMAWPLLDLFEKQMTVCQAIVKRTLHAK